MKCKCGAYGFRGHLKMVTRGLYPGHVFYPVPTPLKKEKTK